jgi:diguanylate cyclase (GGDEF)-like protein
LVIVPGFAVLRASARRSTLFFPLERLPPRVAKSNAIVYTPGGDQLPEALRRWLTTLGVPTVTVTTGDELMALSLRGRPRVVAFDARRDQATILEALRRLKGDSYTGVVPCVVATCEDDGVFAAAFEAGADEVMRESMAAAEATTRLDAMLRRSDRDLVVHPSTRLPGAVEIEAEITRRLDEGRLFATCYADLDHFKEFNDRYSYHEGDRVIRILAKILHDVVKGLCLDEGFVGHIGGDDFIFIIPVGSVNEACAEIVEVFDTLIPYQYSEQDRRAGYFFGKDRRGQLHRVPLMTVSIGVVTNERRHFTHAAQVSELATEMKSYAKTLPGSVFSIDRRQDAATGGGQLAAVTRPDKASATEGK